jgi:hypothetical protein
VLVEIRRLLVCIETGHCLVKTGSGCTQEGNSHTCNTVCLFAGSEVSSHVWREESAPCSAGAGGDAAVRSTLGAGIHQFLHLGSENAATFAMIGSGQQPQQKGGATKRRLRFHHLLICFVASDGWQGRQAML